MESQCNVRNELWDIKLDILIKDFQRFRDNQEQVNKEISMHSTDEDKVQARILTTLKWHTIIGSAMTTAIGAMAWKVIGL